MKKALVARIACVSLLCAALLLAACGPAEEEYVSPYDFNNLEKVDGRYYYYTDGALTSNTGIDVSSHQGYIDWDAVAGDGIDFALIRLGNRGATEGNIYLDERFYHNMEGAAEAGIPRGVYFFSQAQNEQEAVEEAEFVLDHLGGQRLAYPVAFDQEPVQIAGARANNLSKSQLTKNAQAFCKVIEAAGYDTMVYGNKGDAARLDLKALKEHPFWFAEYDAARPSAKFDFAIWQYTNAGTVDGIGTAVDMNIEFIAE